MNSSPPSWRSATLRAVKRVLHAVLYVGVALAAAGCVPIGVRVQNMFM